MVWNAIIMAIVFKLFWFWGRNIPALGVNTMPDDALAPAVAIPSTGIELAVLNGKQVLLFHDKFASTWV